MIHKTLLKIEEDETYTAP